MKITCYLIKLALKLVAGLTLFFLLSSFLFLNILTIFSWNISLAFKPFAMIADVSAHLFVFFWIRKLIANEDMEIMELFIEELVILLLTIVLGFMLVYCSYVFCINVVLGHAREIGMIIFFIIFFFVFLVIFVASLFTLICSFCEIIKKIGEKLEIK
jgi:hypothetical protein